MGRSWQTGYPIPPQRTKAGALVSEALTVGAQLRSEVVGRRAGDFLRAAGPWRDAAEVAEVAESARGWQQRRAPAARRLPP